jgi:hypothetical protein
MNNNKSTQLFGGLVAIVAGVALIGTTGILFALGWALWACGLGALLSALPSRGWERRADASVATLHPAGVAGERRAA